MQLVLPYVKIHGGINLAMYGEARGVSIHDYTLVLHAILNNLSSL